jgi:hypothetical protein
MTAPETSPVELARLAVQWAKNTDIPAEMWAWEQEPTGGSIVLMHTCIRQATVSFSPDACIVKLYDRGRCVSEVASWDYRNRVFEFLKQAPVPVDERICQSLARIASSVSAIEERLIAPSQIDRVFLCDAPMGVPEPLTITTGGMAQLDPAYHWKIVAERVR